MYVVTTEETTIITTLHIHFTLAIALFDFGSNHTFIAKILVDRIGISVEDLG